MEKTELLTIIGAILDKAQIPFEFEDVNGRNVITLSFDDDEALPKDITLTFDDPGYECTTMNYFSIISIDLPPEIMEELLMILPDFNLSIRMGGFGVMTGAGVLYYNYSLLIDELDDDSVLESISACLDVVTAVCAEGKKILLPLLKGEKTAVQLMQEDYQLLI